MKELDKTISKPLFSIGITTYDRVDMLKETLLSILNQTYNNYEVIVGNDNPNRIISGETLGVHDLRIRYYNHQENYGALGNMNYLLGASKGEYFTWLADDDMYAKTFLESVYNALIKIDSKAPVFASYLMDNDFKGRDNIPVAAGNILSGKQFLQQYLARSIKTQGCYGVFDIHFLRRIGGMEQLGKDDFSLYADNLLAIRSGSLEKVIFIEEPLIFYRAHKGSVSLTFCDLDALSSAQKDLCREFVNMFYAKGAQDDFRYNLFLLLKWCITDFATIVLRASSLPSQKQLVSYLKFLNRYMRFLRGSVLYWREIGFLIKTVIGLALRFSRDKFNLKKRKYL